MSEPLKVLEAVTLQPRPKSNTTAKVPALKAVLIKTFIKARNLSVTQLVQLEKSQCVREDIEMLLSEFYSEKDKLLLKALSCLNLYPEKDKLLLRDALIFRFITPTEDAAVVKDKINSNAEKESRAFTPLMNMET